MNDFFLWQEVGTENRFKTYLEKDEKTCLLKSNFSLFSLEHQKLHPPFFLKIYTLESRQGMWKERICSSSCIIVKIIQGMYSITVGSALRVEILPTMEQSDVHPWGYHSRMHWTMTLQHTSTLILCVKDTVEYFVCLKLNLLRVPTYCNILLCNLHHYSLKL